MSRLERSHEHPCERCGVGVDCTGDLENNVDGWPDVVCLHFEQHRAECLCEDCAELVDRADNYEPPDPDGEDIFRDYQAEARDEMDAARRLK